MTTVRVNTRVSQKMNEWLDKQVEEMGFPKSTVIMLALEEYKKQKDTLDMAEVMQEMMSYIKNEQAKGNME